MTSFTSRSAGETFAWGERLGTLCRGGEIFALTGCLGSGKTVLAKGIAAGLGIPPEAVTSPTFIGMAVHRGRLLFVHADAYRFESAEPLLKEGWGELSEGVRVLEWADRAASAVAEGAIRIRLSIPPDAPDGNRRIEMEK